MLYTITEASKQLQVSRVTIYKKIENIQELKTHVKIKNNIKYIDDTGLDIIRQLIDCKPDTIHEGAEPFNLDNTMPSKQFTDLQKGLKQSNANNFDCKPDTAHNTQESREPENTTYSGQFTDLQNKYIESLQNQLEYLKEYFNKELETKNKLIADQARMIENSQILLRENQQKVLLLEDKLKEKTDKPKGLFQRIFSR